MTRHLWNRTPGIASRDALHYACTMYRNTLFVLLLIPGLTHAVICKSVDAEGVVSYADVPAAECEKQVRLPPNSNPLPVNAPACRFDSRFHCPNM